MSTNRERSLSALAAILLLAACGPKPPPPAAKAPPRSPPRDAIRPPPPPPAPQDNFPKIEPKLELVEEGGRWKYRVTGTTELPDRAVLRVKMYYVTIDAKGEEDVTSFYHDAKPLETPAAARDGAFEAALGDFPRKPYPIHYRVVVDFDPAGQPREVLKLVDVPRAYSARADIPAAPKEELEPVLGPVREALVRDYAEIEKLYLDLQKEFTSITSGATDASTWEAWKDGFLDRVDALKAANALRFEIWAVFIERNGKQRLTGLIDLIYDLVSLGTKALAAAGDAREKILVDAKDALDDFKRNHFDALNSLGLAETPDAAALAPLLEEAQKLIDGIAEASATDVASLTLRLSGACTQRMQAAAQELGTALMDGAKPRAEKALADLRAFLKP